MGSKGKNGVAPRGPSWRTPVAGILLAGVALLSLLALWSYRPRGASENWAGPVGHSFAGTLLEATGFGGYALALFQLSTLVTVYLGHRYFAEGNIRRRLLGSLIMVTGAVLIVTLGRRGL